MPAKLIISRESDKKWNREQEFSQEVISIGRDRANAIHLDDAKKIVSRRHAELRVEEGKYKIVDCGSHNFTFVNNEKIARNIPHTLEDGDKIRIGEYTLKFVLTSEEPNRDATVVLVNPYYEEMKILAGLVRKIKRKYDSASNTGRDEDLQQAVQEMLIQVDGGKVSEIIGYELAGGLLAGLNGSMAPAESAEPISIPEPEPKPESKPEPQSFPDPEPVVESQMPAVAMSDAPTEFQRDAVEEAEIQLLTRLGYIVDALLKSIIQIVRVGRRFQREHIGVRIGAEGVHEIEVNTISSEELKEFLLSRDISDEEARRRYFIVKTQVDDAVEQYTALLDLYGVNLNDEIKRILEALDPRVLEAEYSRQSSMYKVFPLLVHKQVTDYLKQKIGEMLHDEGNLFDTEVFKPLFKHAFAEAFDKAKLT